jgi:hypothetical protein
MNAGCTDGVMKTKDLGRKKRLLLFEQRKFAAAEKDFWR